MEINCLVDHRGANCTCNLDNLHEGWKVREVSLLKQIEEQCRLNAMGSEREARLMAQIDELKKENRELRKTVITTRWPTKEEFLNAQKGKI